MVTQEESKKNALAKVLAGKSKIKCVFTDLVDNSSGERHIVGTKKVKIWAEQAVFEGKTYSLDLSQVWLVDTEPILFFHKDVAEPLGINEIDGKFVQTCDWSNDTEQKLIGKFASDIIMAMRPKGASISMMTIVIAVIGFGAAFMAGYILGNPAISHSVISSSVPKVNG